MAERVDAADTPDPVMYVATGDQAETVVSDVARQAAAGAALAFAIYHGGAAFVATMPEPVTLAYMRACDAFRIGR
jgi:hypothetical protein